MTRSRVLWQTNLEGPLLVETGNILTRERQDLVVASGSRVYIFTPQNAAYQLASAIDVNQPILSLAVGLPAFTSENIFVGTANRIVVYGNLQGVITQLSQTEPEPGANFNDMVLADVDGDGRQELAAIAGGNNTLYVYLVTGQTLQALRLELLAIRQLPGTPRSITAFRPDPVRPPFLAIAYNINQRTGIITLFITETGFEEGPAINNLPYQIPDLSAADLLPDPGEELTAAGSDGSVRIFTANARLVTGLVTKNLGSTVTAVAAKTTGPQAALLVAGTPGSYVFGFYSPGITDEPNWAFRAGGPVRDLAIIDGEKVVVGTTNGILQVWQVQNT
ncbi:alpha integrin [Desulforamulus profundi]|uniref:Alpha integrin n=1 Tax=Desulforamulus profundi TaxID=1383067 RepID=A0A2C6MB39_9FIRM|nr:alpha integrin [Desulforamulus profundi]